MKQTKWHFTTHDGKGGIVLYPEPVTIEQVEADCQGRFGDRLKEVEHG